MSCVTAGAPTDDPCSGWVWHTGCVGSGWPGTGLEAAGSRVSGWLSSLWAWGWEEVPSSRQPLQPSPLNLARSSSSQLPPPQQPAGSADCLRRSWRVQGAGKLGSCLAFTGRLGSSPGGGSGGGGGGRAGTSHLKPFLPPPRAMGSSTMVLTDSPFSPGEPA